MRRIALVFLALAAIAPAALPADGATRSGIVVSVRSSPTCPVESEPPQPGCEPRPFNAWIRVIRRADGVSVARWKTGEDGYSRIRLKPARYRVFARPTTGGKLPACGYLDVTVRRGRYPRAAFRCDSGIR